MHKTPHFCHCAHEPARMSLIRAPHCRQQGVQPNCSLFVVRQSPHTYQVESIRAQLAFCADTNEQHHQLILLSSTFLAFWHCSTPLSQKCIVSNIVACALKWYTTLSALTTRQSRQLCVDVARRQHAAKADESIATCV